MTIEQAVAAPLEQQMNGVDNMLYMQSTNANDGTMTETVTFDVQTDVNLDQVNTQNRVAQATAVPAAGREPERHDHPQVDRPALLLIALYSPKGTYDALFLSNYATINLVDPLYRVPGRGPGAHLRRRRLRHAHLGEARPAGQAGHHRAATSTRRCSSRTR